jgi:hypothetical protein
MPIGGIGDRGAVQGDGFSGATGNQHDLALLLVVSRTDLVSKTD